ncbi:MAG: hypothetical protein KDA77_23230, partial [Planctomycetaceae bacterium]|nr:hypothetical protein [Planctomycetaceae bacterium]
NFSANVDDKFYGSLTVALVEEDGETSVELEEAFMQTLGLSAGFIVKAGRFFSNVGYLNQFHAHADDFEDRPLPYRAFLNNQFTDDGIQISWVAPTSLFLELGTELFRGNGFPAGGSDGEGFDNWSVFGHVGGDVGINNSWRAGLSYLSSNAHERETGEGDLFTGDSDLLIADFVWKWAPNGNADNRNFKLQGEYFWRDEDGLFTPDGGSALDYGENQDGWYLQGIYQFMPQWRAGVRYARLHANDPGAAFAGTVLDDHGHDPHDTSVMLDWSPSEFSRLRLQYNMDKTQLDRDDQILLQYIMSIGSHGAHQF